jgi:hypothetical protein
LSGLVDKLQRPNGAERGHIFSLRVSGVRDSGQFIFRGFEIPEFDAIGYSD